MYLYVSSDLPSVTVRRTIRMESQRHSRTACICLTFELSTTVFINTLAPMCVQVCSSCHTWCSWCCVASHCSCWSHLWASTWAWEVSAPGEPSVLSLEVSSSKNTMSLYTVHVVSLCTLIKVYTLVFVCMCMNYLTLKTVRFVFYNKI